MARSMKLWEYGGKKHLSFCKNMQYGADIDKSKQSW